MSYFGDRLKEMLEERNIDKSELAKNVYVHTTTVSQWMKGSFIPKRATVRAIARYLEVKEEDLLGFDDNKLICVFNEGYAKGYNQAVLDMMNKLQKPILNMKHLPKNRSNTDA